MLRRLPFHHLVFACTSLHLFFSSATGGGSNVDGLTFSGGSDGGSLFHLAPIDAAHFGFCVIFAAFTALQTLLATSNIRRRIIGLPPSISSPDFSVGFIFPTFLLISTICKTISYTLHAVYWAKTTNLHDLYPTYFTPAYLGAWNALGFLSDIFLLSAILALLAHRERVLIYTPPIIRGAKRIADTLLVGILTGLSMGHVGLGVAVVEETVGHKLYLAYLSLFLFGVLNVAMHSTILYVYSRESLVNDHSITLYTSFIISPLFFIYSAFPLLSEGLLKLDIVPSTDKDEEQWALANLVVGCVTGVIIIQACLKFGIPPLPENDDEIGNPPAGKA